MSASQSSQSSSQPSSSQPSQPQPQPSPLRSMFRTTRVRRGLAACAVILAAGGLVLFRAPSPGQSGFTTTTTVATPSGPTTATFAGPGAHGRLSLSHGKLLGGAPRTFYAELVLSADAGDEAKQRAPLSLAVVLDTSGSMGGDKIEQAKNSVIELLREMHADDEIAVIRYDSDSSVLQPLARLGNVRDDLIRRVREIQSGGGTNIPPALQKGLAQLEESGRGRVRRVVLVSDGLDSTRAQAEDLARTSAARGVTISSMGIGLDFDEAYMGGVARLGRGNFAFVKDAGALAGFLKREVQEGATTTLENAAARLSLPDGVRFVRAVGADARPTEGGGVELAMGSLFAGDERRVIIELTGDLPAGDLRDLGGQVTWSRVRGGNAEASIAGLQVGGASDSREVEEARNGAVLASAVSALASIRQLEATEAYNRGDGARAQALIQENESELAAAATAAPQAVAEALERQRADYGEAKRAFAAAPPASPEGKAAAKAGAAKDIANMARPAF
jgi:Ca-activated chloride channel family protein